MAPATVLGLTETLRWIQNILLTYALHIIALYVLFSLLRNKYQRHLVGIPGPNLAAYTKLWHIYDIWKGQAHLSAIYLHRKYGPVVRLAPNHVSISDPKMIPVIYNIKDDYPKSHLYTLQSFSWDKKVVHNLFSTRDRDLHRNEKRKVGAAYSLPNILESETAIDSCGSLMIDRLDAFAKEGRPVDMGSWLQYYAFDVVGETTFAMKLGFLEQGKDVDNMMESMVGVFWYTVLCGQVPQYHKFLLGNPLLRLLYPSLQNLNHPLRFTLKAINNRGSLKFDGDLIMSNTEGKDMLSRWASMKASNPLKMTTRDIVGHISTNIVAGSDTTAIALRSILYYLLRNPSCKAKVISEIDDAERAGKLSKLITYRESTTLFPYYNAALKEALRMHPPVGVHAERYVPPEGVEVHGHFLPGGTTVGINNWVVNRDKLIFPDPDIFKPERWLEASPEHLKQMESLVEFNFNAGSRKCIGKNISMVEMQKIIPQLLREYHIDLTFPEKEWTVVNIGLTQQTGFICSLTRRAKSSDLVNDN